MTICFGTRPAIAIDPNQKSEIPNNQPQINTMKILSSKLSTGMYKIAEPPPYQQKSTIYNSTATGSGTDQTKSESLVDQAFKGKLPLQTIGVKNGMPSICFNADEKSRFMSNIKNVIIAKFSHGRPVFKEFNEFLVNMKFKGKFQVSAYDIKHVFVEFDKFEDFARLWMRKSTFVGKYKARFFIWDEDFCPSMETSVSLVWIFLPGLPLYLLTEEALLAIASIIGRPIWVDQRNITHQKTDYAVLCVALDAREQRPNSIWIEIKAKGKNKKVFIQKVIYGEVPAYCGGCFHLGHSITSCRSPKTTENPVVGKQKDLHDVEGRANLIDDAGRSSDETLGKKEVSIQLNASSVEEIDPDDPVPSRHQDNSKGALVKDPGCSNGPIKSMAKTRAVGGHASVITVGSETSTLEKDAHPLNKDATTVSASKPLSATGINSSAHDKAVLNMDAKSDADYKNEALNILHTYVVGCVSGAKTLDVASVGVNTPTKDKKTQNERKKNLEATQERTITLDDVETTPNQKKETKSPKSWHDTVEQNIPMDYSIPPFQNCTDGLVEEIEDSSEEDSEENESSEEGEVQSSDEELDLKQKLEKFEKVSKDLSSAKNTRIICKKHALADIEKGSYSEEEEAERVPEDFNLDPLMEKNGEQVRLSKLVETRVKLIRQRSASPVGRPSTKLKNLQTKLGSIDLEYNSAILMSMDKYEETQRIKVTRRINHSKEVCNTPKRRGRPPKKQVSTNQRPGETHLQKTQEPRKRGRTKKKI